VGPKSLHENNAIKGHLASRPLRRQVDAHSGLQKTDPQKTKAPRHVAAETNQPSGPVQQRGTVVVGPPLAEVGPRDRVPWTSERKATQNDGRSRVIPFFNKHQDSPNKEEGGVSGRGGGGLGGGGGGLGFGLGGLGGGGGETFWVEKTRCPKHKEKAQKNTTVSNGTKTKRDTKDHNGKLMKFARNKKNIRSARPPSMGANYESKSEAFRLRQEN